MIDRPLRDAVHAAEEEDSMRCQQQSHNNKKKKKQRGAGCWETNTMLNGEMGFGSVWMRGLKFVTVATAIEPRPPCQLSMINNGRDLQEPRSLGTF